MFFFRLLKVQGAAKMLIDKGLALSEVMSRCSSPLYRKVTKVNELTQIKRKGRTVPKLNEREGTDSI